MPSGDTIRTVGSIATITVALVGAVWYLASLDGRVKVLEEQVQYFGRCTNDNPVRSLYNVPRDFPAE